jgi:Fur family ferric uptake transcriptional regulator
MQPPEDLPAVLRAHGLQVTAQRLAVLRAVWKRPHGTAATAAELVRAEIGAISQQAVYDALAALTEKGLVRRIQPAGSPALYDPRAGDHHHHAVCRTCRAVVDVDCSVEERAWSAAAANSGFEIDEAELVFWGTCPECRATAHGTAD